MTDMMVMMMMMMMAMMLLLMLRLKFRFWPVSVPPVKLLKSDSDSSREPFRIFQMPFFHVFPIQFQQSV
jgi:predicted MPP superfamily phosphohydrolase